MRKEYFNPAKKLVDETVEWLVRHAKVGVAGVNSLAHVAVVVPTRQAARQLRLALARRFEGRGLIPPYVMQPSQFVVSREKGMEVATSIEVTAALIRFFEQHEKDAKQWVNLFPHGIAKGDDLAMSVVSLVDQFNDIWQALGANGLSMQDVPRDKQARAELEQKLGSELERWEDLADFEEKFFRYLNQQGRRHGIQEKKAAIENPISLPGSVREIVLPALVDPLPVFCKVLERLEKRDGVEIHVLIHAEEKDAQQFDSFGRPILSEWTGEKKPILPLKDDEIIITNQVSELADKVSELFPRKEEKKEVPSLGLVDGGLFPEIEAVLAKNGYELYNPEQHRLSLSSLGRLVFNLLTMIEEKVIRFSTFSAVVRENDVLDAIRNENVGEDGKRIDRRAKILEQLDRYQNENLPLDLSEIQEMGSANGGLEGKYSELAFAYQTVMGWIRRAEGSIPKKIISMLRTIYGVRKIGDKPGDREFVAAVEALTETLKEMEMPIVKNLESASYLQVFRKAIKETQYQLEPATTEVLKTEGWLELAWSGASNIVLAGMIEGAVPDSVVGHAFLPDRLRKVLGLASNEQRMARDTYLLKELLCSREEGGGGVRALVSLTNQGGEVCRPSRLLFLCNQEELPRRVKRLFGDTDAPSSTPAREFPQEWHLDLTDTRERVRPANGFSATALDDYIRCPFTYYLKYVLRMGHVLQKEELGFDDFGTICHDVLAAFGRDEGCRELLEEEEIRAKLKEHFDRLAARQYPSPTPMVMYQLQSAKSRVEALAGAEREHRLEGWRIVLCEERMRGNIRGYLITGMIDRIDYNEKTGKYCIIDYKTWDQRGNAFEKVIFDRAEDVDYGKKMGFPVFWAETKERRWASVQMAMYRELVTAEHPGWEIGEYKYGVLGATPKDSGYWGGCRDIGGGTEETMSLAAHIDTMRETLLAAIEQIEAGIFWPPSPLDNWRWDYSTLFLRTPQEDLLDDAWVLAQEKALLERRRVGK